MCIMKSMIYFLILGGIIFSQFNCKSPEKKTIHLNNLDGILLYYTDADPEVSNSIALDGLKYFGNLEIANGRAHKEKYDQLAWLRFTVVYEYNQPIHSDFILDSLYLSECVNIYQCMGIPHGVYFVYDEKKSLENDSLYFSDDAYSFEGMGPRNIENFNLTKIKNAPFFRIVPLCFFDAKRKESGLSNKNNQDYRAVGATFFLNYPCNEFDLDKLLQDKDFGEMVIKKDTSKVFYATNYKK